MDRKELVAILILAALVGVIALFRLVHMPAPSRPPASGPLRPPRDGAREPASAGPLLLGRLSPSSECLPKKPEARSLFAAAERVFAEAFVAAYEPVADLSLCEAAVPIYHRFIHRYGDEPAAELARLRICQIHTLAKRYAEAARGYDLFVKRHPGSELRSVALLWSGHSHLHLGHRDLAQQRFDAVIAAARRNMSEHKEGRSVELARFRIAKALTLAERHAQAAREYDLLIEEHPNSEFRPMALLWSGVSHERAGQQERARQRFREVIGQPGCPAELVREARRRLDGLTPEH